MVTLALDFDIDDPERESTTQPSASLLRSLDYDIDCESIKTRNLLPAFWATASLTVSHDVWSDTQLSTQLNRLAYIRFFVFHSIFKVRIG